MLASLVILVSFRYENVAVGLDKLLQKTTSVGA